MHWVIFPTVNKEIAERRTAQWQALGWDVCVVTEADNFDVGADMLVKLTAYRGTANAFNTAIAEIRNRDPGAELFWCVNDDHVPAFGCEAKFVHAMTKVLGGGVLQPTGCVDDAYQWCAPCPLITAAYCDLPFANEPTPWPERYYHLFCDQELKEVAELRGQYREIDSVGLSHMHYTRGFADNLPAENRQRNNERAQRDRELYEFRKQYFAEAVNGVVDGIVNFPGTPGTR